MNGRQNRKKNDTQSLSQLEEELKGSERSRRDIMKDQFDILAARREWTP
jgi:uncharacterized membrane protein (DUF106 family)